MLIEESQYLPNELIKNLTERGIDNRKSAVK